MSLSCNKLNAFVTICVPSFLPHPGKLLFFFACSKIHFLWCAGLSVSANAQSDIMRYSSMHSNSITQSYPSYSLLDKPPQPLIDHVFNYISPSATKRQRQEEITVAQMLPPQGRLTSLSLSPKPLPRLQLPLLAPSTWAESGWEVHSCPVLGSTPDHTCWPEVVFLESS